jgi:hypothetical protein
MHQFPEFSKGIIIMLLIFVITPKSYSQKDIIKNGIKINHLDKRDKKQGAWFFFDEKDDIIMSCKYKDDSIVSPLTFYQNNDTAFIRFPKMDSSETFILYLDGQQTVGNYQQITKDSSVIEFIGIYKKVSKDSFYLDTVSKHTFSKENNEVINSWFNKEILPIYMFGNAKLNDYLFAKFHSSNFIFSKKIYAIFYINERGIVEKVDFPRDKNNLSGDEERELSYIFSLMQRWQPYFSGNKTIKCLRYFTFKSTIKY